MKIAYMFGALRRGGTETLMLDLFRNGQKADFQFIGIHRKGGEYREDFYSSGQKLFLLYPHFPLDIFYILKLRKLLKNNKIDIVHAQLSIEVIYAKLATLGTKIKVLQTVHNFDFGMKGFSAKIFTKSLKSTVGNIFVSNFQKNYYIKKYGLSPENQYVVYNCISFDKIDNQKEIVPLLPENCELLLGSVGNFVYVRTQIVICRFLKLLADANYDFRFVFAGLRIDSQAHLYDECVEFCRQNGLLNTKVFFLGGRKDVPNVLCQLDAFIYSSAHDTFGIAVAEAMTAGVPVFVNDWGVMNELTADGEFGTVFKSDNPQDLFEKFTDFIKNRNIYKQKAENANKFVRENFSVEKIFENLNKIYKNIIN
ncbi:MAG: glycosyltransferase family 4 protein [Paludibacter sp.]|nr:glycosyltransferase family 4 protein [Paludibacter sp.]